MFLNIIDDCFGFCDACLAWLNLKSNVPAAARSDMHVTRTLGEARNDAADARFAACKVNDMVPAAHG